MEKEGAAPGLRGGGEPEGCGFLRSEGKKRFPWGVLKCYWKVD